MLDWLEIFKGNMMRRKTKKRCQRIHSKKRALERYNLVLNRFDFREIIKIIHSGKTLEAYSISNRVTVHKLIYADILLRVVYDKMRKEIVTFLPFENKK